MTADRSDRVVFWGQLIATIRTERGMSQRELAQAASVNRPTLRKIEAGKTAGTIVTMEALLSALGYDLDVFLKPVEISPLNTPAKQASSRYPEHGG